MLQSFREERFTGRNSPFRCDGLPKKLSEPSRYRASIWRKLKEAGAVYLQQGAVALPADDADESLIRTLVHEIGQMQGTAYLAKTT